jgi:hypothetical protein
MDLTADAVSGLASDGTEKTGNPDLFLTILPGVWVSPFLAKSEITAPAEELLASAISLAAARIASSISRVVRIAASKHLML